MARPQKNNADYFSHDVGMRNHRKVKALRTKFGIEGYAIWCMFLEHLGSCDFFICQIDEVELEILAGDFNISCDRLNQIVEYLLQIGLLQKEGEIIKSQSLIDRLSGLVEKRERERERVSVTDGHRLGQAVSEMPQSKVKQIKVNTTGGGEEIKKLLKQFYEQEYLEQNKLQFYILIEMILLGRKVEESKQGIDERMRLIEDKCIAVGCVNVMGGVDRTRAHKAAVNMRIRCHEKGAITKLFMSRFGKFLSNTKPNGNPTK